MIHRIQVPDYCDCLGPALVAEWLAEPGDAVEAGDVVCRIEADKIVVDIEAPGGGVLREILAPVDSSLAPGSALGIIADADETIPDGLKTPPPPLPARRLAPVPELLTTELPDAASGPAEGLTPMRSIVARRMTESKLSAPHFYLTTIVDMSGCIELRSTLKRQKIRATYNDMLIKACALALREFPRVASVFSRAGYLPREHMNVGFAVALDPDGLVVPVVRNADRKTLGEVAQETRDLIQRARANKLTPADYSEGVFSVSNLSSFDVDQFTAIVNPGESAILAVGKVTETPIAIKGEVVVRPLMKITLSSDHRVIDGVLAARFAARVKELLQTPEGLV